MIEKKKILYHSDEAARFVTGMSGWVDSLGRFWTTEHVARSMGCTHNICGCGKEKTIGRKKCESCQSQSYQKYYLNKPFKEYDGTPCFIWNDDKFFWDESDILEWVEDFDPEDRPREVDLIVCEEAKFPQVDYVDILCNSDITPEDWEGELPKAIQEKLDELNKVIRETKPIWWVQGKYRTTYKVQEDE